MEENKNLEPLTEKEQKTLVKELLAENRKTAMFAGVEWAVTTVIAGIIFCVAPRSFIGFLFLLLVETVCFLSCGWSVVFPHIKASRAVKKNRWTYHFVDIAEYKPDTQYLHEVLYCINKDDGYHMATTEIKDATKIHVFDCNGVYLTKVDERSCTQEKEEK